VESLYLLWRTTGERRWKEYAWQIFESIENRAKTESGYASAIIQGNGDIKMIDEMQRCARLILFDEHLIEKVYIVASSLRRRRFYLPSHRDEK
jgi:hypothetical protein